MKAAQHCIKFRKHLVYYFIFSVIFSLFAIMICFKINITSRLFPSYYSCNENIDEYYENGISSVYGVSKNLYYSGYDYIINDVVKAHYYYTLDNNTCTIYLISSSKIENPDMPPTIIETLHYTANLETQNQQIKSLLNYMASDLKWNYDGLSKYTQKIFINEYNYHISIYVIMALLTVLGIILSVIFGSMLLFVLVHIKKELPRSSHNPLQ